MIRVFSGMCDNFEGIYGIGCMSCGSLRSEPVSRVDGSADTGDDKASSSFTLLGGGDGVVCRVVVDRPGLVRCDPLDRDEVDDASSSFSFSLLRCLCSCAARHSSQSTPMRQTASSRSARATSSKDISRTTDTGSFPSASHSAIHLRATMLPGQVRMSFLTVTHLPLESHCLFTATDEGVSVHS